MTIRLQDNHALTSHRSKDENGFLIIKDNPIAKAGVFDYLGSEVNPQLPPNEIVKVCRTFKDLEAKKDYFKGKPIKLTHKWVGKDGEAMEADGAIIGEVGANEPYLKADLVIYNPKLIELIESGEIVELSPAYEAKLIEASGAYNGEPFSYKQDLLSVNHLAVVETGRSGSDLRIQDNKPNLTKGDTMKKTFKDSVAELLKRFADTEAESQGEVAELADFDKGELVKEILSVASNSELSDDERFNAVAGLLDKLSQPQGDSDSVEAEAQDNEVESEQEDSEQEAQDDEVAELSAEGGNITAQDLVEIIEKVADAKIAKLKDSMFKESKRVQDTYAEVSKALGTSFDYQGKSVSDLYKFGYEALTKQKLQDGLDSKTAFTMASASKASVTRAKVSDSSAQMFSKLDSLIAKHK